MPDRRFNWAWILVLAAAALAAVILAFLPSREVSPPPAESPRSVPAEVVQPATAPGNAFPLEPSSPVFGSPPLLGGSESSADVWEDRLDNIISADADNQTTVRQLLDGLQRLPVEAQEEYIAHALNLCEDEDYARVETIYLAAGTPPEVSEEIFNDVLNRPDEVKLPLLVKTLRQPAHPMAGEAREILEMYLDLDEGQAPLAGWEAAVQQYLVEEQE